MAKTSNKHKVSDCLDLLRDALAPYVRRQLKLRYHEAWFDRGVENTLAGTLSIQQFKRLQDEEEKYATLDLQALLNIMERRWNDVFAAVLERKARSYIAEIREYRNQLAHQGRFTIHDACRAIETIYLLMQMVSPTNVDAVREIMQQIRQEQFRKDEQTQLEAQMVQINSHPYLKSWREIARPHDDVAQGHFNPEEYAVDLSQVVNHEAAVEYQNPHEFFRRTYLTQGLRDLLEIAIQRLTGKRTSPVIQLQTAFGGGKTHTMLALYHLFGGEFELSALPDLQELVESVIHDDLPIANQAVIVGTQFSAFEPRHYPDGIKTHTIWGDIAYQLGGKEGYELVRKEDEHAISPSSEKMMHLFERFGPALVLIDEWVAFARNLYGKSDLPCGSFDSNLTFVQALTEGAKRSSDALVVASIPESDIEMGGEGGQAAREKLEHAFGRLETIWRPASQEESMEIVRRRLFKEIDEVQRNAVIEEFMTLYQSHRKVFPNETHLHEYRQKMRIAYPIHPELFARLYEDWSTLDRFQRTRGILRLMAMMIHRLWVGNDHSLMIMPSTVPLDLASVSAELTKYLPSSGWDTMLDADVDGKNSRAFRIDVENPHFGKCSAARRVARTIFIGSVAKDNKKNNRGIDESRVRLGCVQPQENVILFNDAMRRLQEELTYLYTEHKRYWFDKQPSLNRLALERAELLDESVDVMPEIIRRLEALSQQHRYEFVNVYPAPDKSREVPDEQAVSLVILPPDRTYRKGIKDNKAEVYAEEVLLKRGDAPRIHRNMLVFLAPDASKMAQLSQSVRRYLAWKSIVEEKESLNLDTYQMNQAKKSKNNLDESIQTMLPFVYEWLLVPKLEMGSKPNWIGYHLGAVDGNNPILKASRKLIAEEELLIEWSPRLLKTELDQKRLWKDQLELPIHQLWGYFTQYVYLPRLKNQEVLRQAIQKGLASKDFFGFARRKTDDTYHGFLFNQLGAQILIDEQSLLIKPELARIILAQQDKEKAEKNKKLAEVSPVMEKPNPNPQTIPKEEPMEKPKTTLKRFNGIAKLDPERLIRDVSVISEEMIQLLQSLDQVELDIQLDMEIRVPKGIPDHLVRALKENGKQLNVQVEFYEE